MRYVRSNRGQKHAMPAWRDRADETRWVELPDETGPVPVSFVRAEPRWFGVPPPLMLLLVTVLTFVLAIALFASGSWPFGLIFLGLSALLAAALLELARRRPWDGAWSWVIPRLELLRVRSQALAESQRLRGNQAVIEAERRAALLRLGEAERSGDAEAASAARVRLEELKRAERKALADERIRSVRMSIDQTVVVRPEDSRRPAA
jgi:ABC-type multidrug transport system fused ATPase/permease subunit